MARRQSSFLAHTNLQELRDVVSVFTRVWAAGDTAKLDLETQNGKLSLRLDLKLGAAFEPRPGALRTPGLPPGYPPKGPEGGARQRRNKKRKTGEPRPGAPEVRGEGPGLNHGTQRQPQPSVRRPRHRGPAARARDAARRAEWLRQREQQQQQLTAAAAGQSDTDSVTTVEDTATVTSEQLVTHLSLSTPGEEKEWTSEPMSGSQALGVRLPRQPGRIVQLDGGMYHISTPPPLPPPPSTTREEPIYVVELDSDGLHVGKGTENAVSRFQLCEFLRTPPARVRHPDYGLGTFVKIDVRDKTFVYQFDSILTEV